MSPAVSDGSDRIVGIDWGTTNCRAFLFDEDGKVIANAARDAGMKRLTADEYPAVLETLLAELGAESPRLVVIAGMAGAKGGWREVPYVACPASPDRITAGALHISSDPRVYILPGLVYRGSGPVDVMRGEETQIAGLATRVQAPTFTALIPGTHSKWIGVSDGTITGFTSFMTGEIYEVMSRHSVFAAFRASDVPDRDTFLDGVDQMRRCGDGGWRLLFSTRAGVVAGDKPEAGALSYLSGLLIGAEIRDAAGLYCGSGKDRVHLVASSSLTGLYRDALAVFGIEAVDAGIDAAAAGLWHLGQTLASPLESQES